MAETAASLREAALSAERAGQEGQAALLFDKAILASPNDPHLLNSAAGSALRLGDATRAEVLYRRAHALQPAELEFAVNLAIALGRLGQDQAAVALLRGMETHGKGSARYWSARAASERDAGDLAAAAASYDRCLLLEPGHQRGLHGRARVALETGERDAADRYAAALAVSSGDANLWLGRAMALEAAGDVAEALQIAKALSDQMPGWLDGHRYLAELRLNIGESGEDADSGAFADHYATAVTRLPENAELAVAWSNTLAGADRFAGASSVAEQALARMPDDPRVGLAAAMYASACGDLARAEAIFAALPGRDADRCIEEARHRLRLGDPQAADALLEAALVQQPHHVSAWALRSIAWRLLADPREEWLHGQEGLVTRLPLHMEDIQWEETLALLNGLHDDSFLPVGQSVRGGSQTRGALFSRSELPLRRLHAAIVKVIDRYREQLPAKDLSHPLLRHRDDNLSITGSWSVRLAPGGRHTVHIHPRGVLSSALYLGLPPPQEDDPRAGWLELGGAPPEMGINLPPSAAIEPWERHLTLFPSTLFHGTRPFSRGRRMTVAFDVTTQAVD